MKIKCPCYPWCNEELETEKDLGNHLFAKHKHDEVCISLASKIFKIYEKIEDHEFVIRREGGVVGDRRCLPQRIEELKSILENEN